MGESHHFTCIASGKKEQLVLPLASLVKHRPSICALKYVNSKATYPLSMIESHNFTVQQLGKRSGSCYHYQITSLIKDRVSSKFGFTVVMWLCSENWLVLPTFRQRKKQFELAEVARLFLLRPGNESTSNPPPIPSGQPQLLLSPAVPNNMWKCGKTAEHH